MLTTSRMRASSSRSRCHLIASGTRRVWRLLSAAPQSIAWILKAITPFGTLGPCSEDKPSSHAVLYHHSTYLLCQPPSIDLCVRSFGEEDELADSEAKLLSLCRQSESVSAPRRDDTSTRLDTALPWAARYCTSTSATNAVPAVCLPSFDSSSLTVCSSQTLSILH